MFFNNDKIVVLKNISFLYFLCAEDYYHSKYHIIRVLTLNIAILSRNKNLYSTRRIVEAAIQRGHDIRVVDYIRSYMNITSSQPSIHYRGEKLPHFDAVIPRIGAKRTFYGAAVTRQFEAMGVYTINPSIAITRSRDNPPPLQLLSRKGIGMPITGIAHSPGDVGDLIRIDGGAPLGIKILEGTQGVGISLAETKKAAESVIEAFIGVNVNIIVQE